MKRYILVGLLGAATSSFAADIVCPPMPGPVTDRNRDVKGEIAASVGSLGKIKAGEIGIKAEATAESLFARFPNVDRLLTIQTMTSTYCGILRSSDLPDSEKLSRWERFTDKVLGIESRAAGEMIKPPLPIVPPSAAETDSSKSKPPSPKEESKRDASAKPLVVQCYVTAAGLCGFTIGQRKLWTLQENHKHKLSEVPGEQIWDDANLVTTGSRLYVVKRSGKAAVYSAAQYRIVFDYKYDDLTLTYRPDRAWPPTSNIEDFFIVAKKANKRGLVDFTDKTLIGFQYDQILSSWDNSTKTQYFSVMNSSLWGLLDGTGKEVLPVASAERRTIP